MPEGSRTFVSHPVSAPTILDVIENALGERPSRNRLERLTLDQIEELSDLMRELWVAQADEPVPDGGSLIGGWLSSYWSEKVLRHELSDSLLYYPKLLVLDPLANFFDDRAALPEDRPIRYRRGSQDVVMFSGPRIWSRTDSFEEVRQSPSEAARRFASIVLNLYDVEVPIREGVIVLRSQWPVLTRRRPQLESAVRHDVGSAALQDFIRGIPSNSVGPMAWDNLQGLAVSADGEVRPADAPWRAAPFFYYVNKMLAVADATGSQYVPSTEVDLQLLRLKVDGGMQRIHPGALLREVSRIAVPSLDLPLNQAAAIRRSSSGFEEWRSIVRKIQRDASADTADELRERVEDELQPRLNALKRDLKRNSLASITRDDGAGLVIDATLGLATAAATGEPAAGVAAMVAGGVLRWLWRAYGRDRPAGANAVLATLIHGKR